MKITYQEHTQVSPTYQFLRIRIFETQPTMTDATNNTIVEIVAPEATPRILLVLGWEIAFKKLLASAKSFMKQKSEPKLAIKFNQNFSSPEAVSFSVC